MNAATSGGQSCRARCRSIFAVLGSLTSQTHVPQLGGATGRLIIDSPACNGRPVLRHALDRDKAEQGSLATAAFRLGRSSRSVWLRDSGVDQADKQHARNPNRKDPW